MTEREPLSGAVRVGAVLRRRRTLAVAVFVVSAALAVALGAFLPPMYRSRALVLIDPPLVPNTTGESLEERLQKLTQQNLSRSRLLTLAAEHGLMPRGAGADEAADAIRRDVKVESTFVEQPGGKASVAVAVSVRGRDARKVAAAANAFARFYVEVDGQTQLARAQAIAAELDELGRRLEQEEAQSRESKARQIDEVERLTADLESVEAQKNRTLLRQRAGREPVRRPAAGEPESAAARSAAVPAADPSSEPADVEIARLRAELSALRARYSEEHPDVIRLVRQIEILSVEAERKRLALRAAAIPAARPAPSPLPAAPEPRRAAAPRGPAPSEVELQDLARRERELRHRLAVGRRGLAEEARPVEEPTAESARRETSRTVYQALLRRQEELRLALNEAGQRGPFRLIEEAVPAEHPYAPDRTRVVLVGIALALLLAAAAVGIVEQLDTTFHGAGDLKAFAGVPVVVTIPRIVTAGDRVRSRWRAAAVSIGLAAAAATVLVGTRAAVRDDDALVRAIARGGP